MIVWRGWGVLVIVIVFACSLAANFLSNAIAGKAYWDSRFWPLALAMVLAGGLIWIAGMILSQRPARNLVDEKTGERVTLAGTHDFFFLRMKWWGPIVAVLGIGSMFFR